MAQTLYARTAARGFPVFDDTGMQTGVGHLQDVTRLPDHAGLPTPGQPYPVNDPANTPAQLAPPEEYILGLQLWGLPGSPSDDITPHGYEYPAHQIGDIGPGVQGVDYIPKPGGLDAYPVGPYHDAPLIDPGLAVEGLEVGKTGKWRGYLEANAAFGENNNAQEILNPGSDGWLGGFSGVMRQDHVGPVEGNQQPLQEAVPRSLRGNAGLDAVQGYGGGGKGPGGTNLPEITEDHRDYPGEFYAADAFTQVGEVPHLDAETAQFIQNQPGQAPWTGDMWDLPLVQTHAQDIIPADVPLQGPQLADNFTVQPMWGL